MSVKPEGTVPSSSLAMRPCSVRNTDSEKPSCESQSSSRSREARHRSGSAMTSSRRLEPMEGIEIHPLTHGNALSIYFNDPEGNGLEVFWDTPWHVAQPMVRVWDPGMNEAQALAWVEEEFQSDPGFAPIEEYREQRRAELAAV